MLPKTIEPSLLAFDPQHIPEQLMELKQYPISIIHYDVMDGYVNNHSFETEWLDTIHEQGFKINVHLMVYDPLKWIKRFVKYPLNTLTFQFEAVDETQALECLTTIKQSHIKAGIAVKPFTPTSQFEKLLNVVEIVTVMTVEPGKGGQKLVDEALKNLQFIFEYRQTHHLHYLIEVDGGIKLDNVHKVLKYADYIISGTGFMQLNQADKNQFIAIVKG